MSRVVAATLSVTSLAFVGCHHAAPRHPAAETAEPLIGPLLHRHLLTELGAHAINCGWSGDEAEFASMSECALDAAKHAKPFIVQYREVGVDSAAQIGFILKPDQRLMRYPMPDGNFSPNNIWFELHDCQPGSLYRNSRKTLDCKIAGEPRFERE